MPRTLIGAASWHDIASFYPSGCRSPADKLRFYASEFPLVEVDTSYYAIPRLSSVSAWAENTPANFTFDVKAFRLLTTHQTAPRVLSSDVRAALPADLAGKRTIYYKQLPASVKELVWGEFAAMLEPLWVVGKLGVVLFQFPFWFMPGRDSFSRRVQRAAVRLPPCRGGPQPVLARRREPGGDAELPAAQPAVIRRRRRASGVQVVGATHIDECRERLSDYRLAVEVRNRYWLDDENLEETLSFLRRSRLSFVAVDEPQGFKSSVPPLADVTADIAVVRFHGRNLDTWEKKGLKSSKERFDYYYAREEIEEWAPRIAIMARDAGEVHVIMNTNNRDQAVTNARLAGEVLGEGIKPRQTLL